MATDPKTGQWIDPGTVVGFTPPPQPRADNYGNPVSLRSPRQASRAFGFDRLVLDAPRPKFMFVVRFKRSGAPGQNPDPKWEKGLSFAVKAVDRPNVSPEVQELSQYNKKRQVHIGIKYQPVNITFYDTVDSKLFLMWEDYMRWYFGDFRQGPNKPGSWAYDITTEGGMLDNGEDFGFAPNMVASPLGDAMPYFFSAVEVYQFFANSFIQFDLVNPKITNFSPDELDYENGQQGATIRMTLAYEAIIYHNTNSKDSGKPIPISTNKYLSELFGDTPWLRDVINPQGFQVPGDNAGSATGGVTNIARMATVAEAAFGANVSINTPPGEILVQQQQQARAGASALNNFGSFNFGNVGPSLTNLALSRAASGNFQNLGGALLGAAGQGTLSGVVSDQNPARALGSSVLSGLPGPLGGISGQLFDSASGRVGIGTSPTSGIRSPSIAANVGQGLAAAAISTVVSAPTRQQPIIRGPQGLNLSDQAMGAVNLARPSQAQYGTRVPWRPDEIQVQ